MIQYIKCRHQLKVIRNFYKLLQQICSMEDAKKDEYYLEGEHPELLQTEEIQRAIQEKCIKNFADYSSLRNRIAQEIPKIHRIARSIDMNTGRFSYPPPSTGKPILVIDIFDSLLEDQGYEPTTYVTRLDTLNKMIGILESNKKCAFFQAFNPFHWISLILRLPFILVEKTGFNVGKIENHLLGSIFRIIFWLAIIYGLLRLGFSHNQLMSVWTYYKKLLHYRFFWGS